MSERYRIVKKLGEGSYGSVFEAEHTRLRRRVALKRLHADALRRPTTVERFYREGEVCAKLDHPNIIRVLDCDEDASGPYIAFEFFEGESLAKTLEGVGRLAPRDSVAIALQTLDALSCAHDAGVIHRDIKPANILIGRDLSQRPTVKLIDFGVAKEPFRKSLTGLTKPGEIVGSLAYMAPEQMHNRGTDQRSDLYSAAVCLYVMLTGKRPFDAQTVPDLLRQLAGEPTPILNHTPSLPSDLARIVHRGLERDPNLRHASARAFLDLLRRIRFDEGSLTPRKTAFEQSTLTEPIEISELGSTQWPQTEVATERNIAHLSTLSQFEGPPPIDMTSDAVTAVDHAKRLLELAAPHLAQRQPSTSAKATHETFEGNVVTEKLVAPRPAQVSEPKGALPPQRPAHFIATSAEPHVPVTQPSRPRRLGLLALGALVAAAISLIIILIRSHY